MATDMRAEIGAMLEEYRAAQVSLARLQTAAMELTATARSSDRRIAVTVDAQGGLRDLRIDPSVRADPSALAERIVALAEQAATQARERLRELVRVALPERLRDLVDPDGTVDLARLLPAGLADLGQWGYRP
jgi:DNA-binding protein YbaB